MKSRLRDNESLAISATLGNRSLAIDVANLVGRCTVLSTVTIIGLDHVQIAAPAGCEPDARHFFGELLGLSELEKPEPLQQRGGVWFALGQQQLHIGVEKAFAPAQKAHPALSVSPGQLDALAARLAAAGAEVVWDDALPGVRRFYSEDPWGNRLEFVAGVVSSPD
jgi:catechol 2,3-dioxygenase-like lactoylglutathione lyase family enzyme